MIDGLKNIKRVVEYTINEKLWDEYLALLDELPNLDANDRRTRMRQTDSANMYIYNAVTLTGAFNADHLPDHVLHKEFCAP